MQTLSLSPAHVSKCSVCLQMQIMCPSADHASKCQSYLQVQIVSPSADHVSECRPCLSRHHINAQAKERLKNHNKWTAAKWQDSLLSLGGPAGAKIPVNLAPDMKRLTTPFVAFVKTTAKGQMPMLPATAHPSHLLPTA
jgi:hypothetical protein